MKRLMTSLLALLVFTSCSANINSKGSCNCINDHEYSLINKYNNVEARFLSNTAEFYVCWREVDQNDIYTGNMKEWTIYLSGYYVLSSSAGYYVFYECEYPVNSNTNSYDYYLVRY